MISVKEAAAALKISPRSVQEKCNKFKVAKANGQFQITQELLDLWLTKAERKTNEAAAQPKPRTELAKTLAENRALSSWQIVIICAAVAALVVGLIVWHYTDKIDTLEKTDKAALDKEKAERKADNDDGKAKIQELKTELSEVKDELKTIKSDPRIKRFLKP